MAKLVFSTRTMEDQRNKSSLSPSSGRSLPPHQQKLKVSCDKKGRRGKVVTVISGFSLSEADLHDLAKSLKTLCGAGGTVKNENSVQVIEIQGDHRTKLVEKLTILGYKI